MDDGIEVGVGDWSDGGINAAVGGGYEDDGLEAEG